MDPNCPHCTAPLPVDDSGSLPHCPQCDGEILVTKGEESFIIVTVATATESQRCHVTLESLQTLGLRDLSGDDIQRVDVTLCPVCSHPLRLENLGHVDVESGTLHFSFPARTKRTITCSYCQNRIEREGVDENALVVEVKPPARDSHELELEKFLDGKPVWEESPTPSGGCFSSILLVTLTALLWIL